MSSSFPTVIEYSLGIKLGLLQLYSIGLFLHVYKKMPIYYWSGIQVPFTMNVLKQSAHESVSCISKSLTPVLMKLMLKVMLKTFPQCNFRLECLCLT